MKPYQIEFKGNCFDSLKDHGYEVNYDIWHGAIAQKDGDSFFIYDDEIDLEYWRLKGVTGYKHVRIKRSQKEYAEGLARKLTKDNEACHRDIYSSRTCELGTKGCNVKHV